MSRIVIISLVFASLLVCCGKSKSPESSSSEDSVTDFSGENPEQVSEDDTVILKDGFYVRVPKHPTKGITPSRTVMDDDEDAYEEGRSLGEEDRRNHTRNHEGHEYGHDDDYDDGYSEEE